MQKGSLLYSGKVKSIYATHDPDYVIAEFRDDTTAFDGQKHALLADKGHINNAISAFIMEHLAERGIPTHFVKRLSSCEVLLKRLTMIPLESVVRNRAAGSLCKRLGIESGKLLHPPLLELFLKNDDLHDPMINENHALSFGWATQNQLDTIRIITLKINSVLTELFVKADMILVDAKFEFGVGADGKVYLGDEISPDSCRIWDVKTLQPLDKDRFRKDLGGVMEAYREVAKRLSIQL